MRKIYLILFAILIVFSINSAFAVIEDYAARDVRHNAAKNEVVNQNGNASPVDRVTGSSINQFTTNETNSRVDDYINQDEQVQIDPGKGTDFKVLRTNQKINVNKYITALIPLKKAPVRELRHPFRVITRKEGGNADVVQDKNAKEFFMQVVCPEFQLPYLKKAAEALDEEWIKRTNDGSGELYYKAKFRPIRDVVGNLFAPDGNTQWYRGPEGYWFFDDLNNAVYFNDQPAVIPLFKKGLSECDIPPNQVSLDITIYEVNLTNDVKMGFDFIAWKNNVGRSFFEFIAGNQHSFQEIDGNPISGDTNLYEFRYFGMKALLTAEYVDFLQSKGKAKVLTKGNILTKSGRRGELASVDEILGFKIDTTGALPAPIPTPAISYNDMPYADKLAATTCAGNQYMDNVFDSRPAAFPRTLNVRTDDKARVGTYFYAFPYIGTESMELFTSIYVSSVVGINSSGLPVISQRYMDSNVRLKNGEPFVLAGLKKTSKIETTNKIPLLGSIPVLGYLFGNEANTNQETELVCVITPKFIIGAESDLEMPKEAKTVVAQVQGSAPLPLPKTSLGFDQWLLDSEK